LLSHPVLAAQAKKQQSQLAGYDALGLAELIKRKQVSPIEVVDDVIRRVERVNPKINARAYQESGSREGPGTSQKWGPRRDFCRRAGDAEKLTTVQGRKYRLGLTAVCPGYRKTRQLDQA
jgi:hypothetical protein